MKAVLEIEMPKRCIGCPCESDARCQALDGLPISKSNRRNDCPLKPIENT